MFIDFAAGESSFSGGVEIPYRMGLAGHSDADVLCHAVINAVLGAMSEGDIGVHFPDTDPRYRGIASTKMLDTVLRIMRRRHFKLVNVDVTLVAQQPKLAPYYAAMKKYRRPVWGGGKQDQYQGDDYREAWMGGPRQRNGRHRSGFVAYINQRYTVKRLTKNIYYNNQSF